MSGKDREDAAEAITGAVVTSVLVVVASFTITITGALIGYKISGDQGAVFGLIMTPLTVAVAVFVLMMRGRKIT